jgi:putative transposase
VLFGVLGSAFKVRCGVQGSEVRSSRFGVREILSKDRFPEELDAAVRRFKKIIERALGRELTHHLGYPPGGQKPDDTTNHRNGTGGRTVLTDDGPLPIDVPRDRERTFEPRLIGKHKRRFTGFVSSAR